MIGNFFRKLYGNAVVLANLKGQRSIPYLPEEELKTRRDARLRRIVNYASKTVPFYRDFFREKKIDPLDIRTVEDLDLLPILDKDTVRMNPHLFVAISRRARQSIPFVTSGSTGMPLKVSHDQYSLLANIAFGEREREVVSTICEKKFGYKEVIIAYPGNTGSKVLDFYQRMTFIPLRPERLVLSVQDPIERIVEAVNHFRPDVIKSYGSYLETFFRLLNFRRIEMFLPRVLIYGADSMTSEGRSFIEKKFGIPILSTYNAVEIFKIGFFLRGA